MPSAGYNWRVISDDEWDHVNDLLRLESGLSDREIEFLDKLYDSGSAVQISARQAAWLERIAERMLR